MNWIDCKHRMPTAEDGNKHGDVFWRRGAEFTFSGIWNARACDLVAWMPIPEFVPLPEPPAGYRILADRSLPWHPHTKHWVQSVREWQTSGGHHKREYIGDDIFAVPIEPLEPPEPPEGYRLVTDHDETPHPEARYWYAGGVNWSIRDQQMVGKKYIKDYAYAVPIDPPKPPEGFRIVDTATEPFNAMAHFYCVKLDRWVRTLARGDYSVSLTYAVPIAPPKPPAGYEIVTDLQADPHLDALYFSAESNEFLPRKQHREYMNGNIYAVPIDPPKPQYRPFKNADEFRPYRQWWFRLKTESEAKTEYPPRAFCDTGYSHFSWADALETLVFECGHPFGVKLEDTQ